MSAYRAVFSARVRALLQYRAAALAGLATQIFWGLIRTMILYAFYENATSTPPMGWQHVLAYIWLSQAFFALFPLRTDSDVAAMIRSGNVAYELLRPVDLYSFWYARAIANRLAPTVLRCVPILTVAILAGWLRWVGWGSFIGGVASLGLAALVSASITTLMTLSLFVTISGQGIGTLISMSAYLLSGMVLPLPLFPDWLQPLLRVLPFRAVCDLPFRAIAGHIPAAELPGVLLFQLVWLAGLVLMGRLIVARVTRRLVVQGG
jgi:ABC-2 type transport system permease protein